MSVEALQVTDTQKEIEYNEFPDDTVELESGNVYQAFRKRFARPHFRQNKLDYDQIHVDRVLHIDREDGGDRSMHLIVRSTGDTDPTLTFGVRPEGSKAMNDGDYSAGMRKVNRYNPDSYLVATTDGQNITRWKVDGVHGYDAPPAPKSYDHRPAERGPDFEMMAIDLIAQNAEGTERRARLILGKGSNDGVMQLEQLAWILDGITSKYEQDMVDAVPPVDDIVRSEKEMYAREADLIMAAIAKAALESAVHVR